MGHSGRKVRLVFDVKPAERSFFRRPGELCHVVREHLEGLLTAVSYAGRESVYRLQPFMFVVARGHEVVVEMEEGVRVVGALNGDPGALELDLPVTAEIDRVSEKFARIVFNLVG